MNTRIRALFFDVGGVLIRTEDRRSRIRLAKRLGKNEWELEAIFFGDNSVENEGQLGSISAAEHWRKVGVALHLNPEEMLSARRDFFRGDRLDEELMGFIRKYRALYKLAIITNALDDVRPALINKFQIAGDFDHIIVSAEEGVMKPDPEIYHRALERVGVSTDQALFVDDMRANVEAARNLGWTAVLFNNTHQALREINAHLGLG